ncbi:MAG: hypothetical protein KDE51_21805, partial [Anaerolineales bacterium]|nr:hypothetical protein [Anaerolineales bacterium]
IRDEWLNYVRLAGIGLLLGFGFWSHQMIVVYAAVICLLWMLQSPEWRQIHRILPPAVWPFVTLALGGMVVSAFFSAACEPQASFQEIITIAQLLLLTVVGWSLIGFGWVSTRRNVILRGTAVLGASFLMGNYPQWRALLLGNGSAENALTASCPTGLADRGFLLITEIIPHVWGASWLVRDGAPPISWLETIISIFAMPLMVAAVGFFIWHWRYILGALLTLRPIVEDDVKIILVGALFVIPILLAAFGGNTVDVLSTRYLLLTWQAGAIVVGWFVMYISRRANWLGVAAAAVLIIQIGAGYMALGERWESGRFEPQEVAQLERFLVENSVYGGYADYWDTYTLNFLMNERIVFTPMNGVDRYPRYTNIVTDMSARAYILPREFVRNEDPNLDLLIAQLQANDLPAGFANGQALADLHNANLLERDQIANWDVWIIKESSP